MKTEYSKHFSVLNKEVIEFFFENDCKSSFYLDMTFGAGGHTLSILEKIPNSIVIAFDQDPEAYKAGLEKIESLKLQNRFLFFNKNFSELQNVIDNIKETFQAFNGFSGVIADLGVSSHHFDDAKRGFSFRFDAPLDMRMNPNSNNPTAADVVNEMEQADIEEILRDYGEEKFSKLISENICKSRLSKKILTTKDLENIIFHSYPKKLRYGKLNPSTKTFQALRIFVNRELDVLTNIISQAFDLLSENGIFAIISFHSLEDRIVKHQFRELKEKKIAKVITKKPIIPSDEEIKLNLRSRSAKLRVVKKTNEAKYGKKHKRKEKKQAL